MKKIVSILLMLVIICCCTSCKNETVMDANNLQNEMEATYLSGEHVAYYLVFNKLIEKSPQFLENVKYLVVDTNNTCLTDTKYLSDLFDTYAKQKNLVFFMDTKEGLIERKHITNGENQEGIVLTYKDIECSQDKISIELEIWNSDSKHILQEFNVEKIKGEWKIV